MKKINEAPANTLYRNTKTEFSTAREEKSTTIQVTSMLTIPYPNELKLEFKFETRSGSQNYESVLLFENVLGEGSRQAETNPNLLNTVLTPDGTEYKFITLSKIGNNLRVHCTCLDFYYRFATWNHRDNSLYGDPPPPYVQKTDREPVNPNQVSGLCKHLMACVERLVVEKYVV